MANGPEPRSQFAFPVRVALVDNPGCQWESGQQCLTNFQKGRRTVKKLLSALVVAGFLAGLGCGGDTGTTKEKDKKTTTPPKEKTDAMGKDKKDKNGG